MFKADLLKAKTMPDKNPSAILSLLILTPSQLGLRLTSKTLVEVMSVVVVIEVKSVVVVEDEVGASSVNSLPRRNDS